MGQKAWTGEERSAERAVFGRKATVRCGVCRTCLRSEMILRSPKSRRPVHGLHGSGHRSTRSAGGRGGLRGWTARGRGHVVPRRCVVSSVSLGSEPDLARVGECDPQRIGRGLELRFRAHEFRRDICNGAAPHCRRTTALLDSIRTVAETGVNISGIMGGARVKNLTANPPIVLGAHISVDPLRHRHSLGASRARCEAAEYSVHLH